MNLPLRFAIFGAGFWARVQLAAGRGERAAETTGADNFQAMELVFAAYDSARTNSVITMQGTKRK